MTGMYLVTLYNISEDQGYFLSLSCDKSVKLVSFWL